MDSAVVDVIFTKLTLVYGARFRDTYKGLHVDQVKSDWLHELGGLDDATVHWALQNLPPDHPPNVLQFRQLCNRRPEPMRALIPPPKGMRMSPEVRAKLAQVMRAVRNAPNDPLAGARALRAKEQAGILLTRAQREFWRTALKRELEQETSE